MYPRVLKGPKYPFAPIIISQQVVQATVYKMNSTQMILKCYIYKFKYITMVCSTYLGNFISLCILLVRNLDNIKKPIKYIILLTFLIIPSTRPLGHFNN